MSGVAKTIVATGTSSGLGFEAVKQLLLHSAEPYRFILGARDTKQAQVAYDELKFDGTKHSISILPLELSDLRSVKSFAQQTLGKLDHDKVDILFLNAAIVKDASGPGPHGSQWCDTYVVNHLSQHYLIHLLREKLIASQSRIVVVSTGAVRRVRDNDPTTLDGDLKAGADTDAMKTYGASKFTQILGAHYWRRQLQDSVTVLAVTPGPIPYTGVQRHTVEKITMDYPGARTIPEGIYRNCSSRPPKRFQREPNQVLGAQSLLDAFTRDDLPADPEQILLSQLGEWWPKEVYALSLDKDLQDKWCLSKEEIEKEAGISA
ncbi:hypothetical protein BX600DRAFT_517262 [Xylariales sp. PMI_506]|nr:hypothetical protein BX600DRAFT_517262 [Xylariales sp. PMI_506]